MLMVSFFTSMLIIASVWIALLWKLLQAKYFSSKDLNRRISVLKDYAKSSRKHFWQASKGHNSFLLPTTFKKAFLALQKGHYYLYLMKNYEVCACILVNYSPKRTRNMVHTQMAWAHNLFKYKTLKRLMMMMQSSITMRNTVWLRLFIVPFNCN